MFLLIVLWEFGGLHRRWARLSRRCACLAGSFVALTLTGITLNISSFMGIIMVAESPPRTASYCSTVPSMTSPRARARAKAMADARMRLRPI